MAIKRQWTPDLHASTFQSLAATIVYDSFGNLVFQGTGTRLAAWSPLGSMSTFSVWLVGLKLSAIPTTSAAILSPLTSGGAQSWRLMVNTAGAIQIRDAANAAGTAYGTACAINTAYDVKLEGTLTAITITLYDSATHTQIGTPVTMTSTMGAVDNFRFGNATGTIGQYTLGGIYLYDTTAAPAFPAPSPAKTGPRIAIIGDSLTNMAPDATSIFGLGQQLLETSFTNRGYHYQNIYMWGVGGKRIGAVADLTGRTSISNWADAAAQMGTIDDCIIALGTNDRPQTDAVVNAEIDALHAVIPSTVRVHWLTLTSKGFASTDDIRLNGLIAAKVAARPLATLGDWNARIRSIDGGDVNSPLFQSADSTHMTALGYPYRSDFMAEQVPNLKQPWDNLYVGSAKADRMYVGSNLVWAA